MRLEGFSSRGAAVFHSSSPPSTAAVTEAESASGLASLFQKTSARPPYRSGSALVESRRL